MDGARIRVRGKGGFRKPAKVHSLRKNGAAPVPVFHPKYEELVNFPQLYRRICLNKRAQAVGVVKVICPQKWVREFNNREILEQKLMELKVGKGFPGAQQVNRFFQRPTDLYSIKNLDTEAEVIPFYSVDRVKRVLNNTNSNYDFLQKEFWGKLSVQPLSSKRAPRTYFAGFPGDIFTKDGHFMDFTNVNTTFRDYFEGAEGKKKSFTMEICHFKII